MIEWTKNYKTSTFDIKVDNIINLVGTLPSQSILKIIGEESLNIFFGQINFQFTQSSAHCT